MRFTISNNLVIQAILFCLMFYSSSFAQNNFRLDQTSKIQLNNEGYQGEIALEADKFVQIEINGTADSVTKVLDSKGNNIADDSFEKLGTNSKLFFITEKKGAYRIELKLNSFTPKEQPIDIKISDLRTATGADKKAIELQKIRREAYSLSDKKDTESKNLARQKRDIALDLARQIGDKTAEGEMLSYIGYYEGINQPEKGAELLLQAAEIFMQNSDKSRLAHIYYILGNNYIFAPKPNYMLGLEQFRKCVETGEKLETNLIIASCLINIGATHQNQGEFGNSADYFERALSVFRKYRSRGEITALNNLIIANTALGKVKEALQYYADYKETIARYKLPEDCKMSLQIGFLQYNLQNWKTSRELFKATRTACQIRKDLTSATLALIGEGAALTGEGEGEKALSILNSALEESRSIKSKLAEGTALAALGVYYDSVGDAPNALKFSEEAKPILAQLREITLLNIALTTIGKNRLKGGEIENAEATFRELLERSRKIRYAKQEAAALFGLAQTADKKGDLAEARKNIEDSIKIIESNRGQIPTDALRVSFFASVANYYDFSTDLLMRLHRQNPDSGFDKLAFQAAESSDARSLLNQLREAGTDIRVGVASDLIAKEKRLREELNAQNAAQLKMLTTFAFPAQLEKVRSEISRLNAEYEQITAQIAVTSPAFASLTQPKPLSLSETQKQLDSQTVLLKYALGEERSYLFAVTADSFRTFELPQKAEIETRIRNFRRLLTVREQTSNSAEIKNADAELATESAELSKILLGQIGDLTNKRLAIIPSGAMQFVPFAALKIPNSKTDQYGAWNLESGTQYLIEANEITILPSASVLAFQRQEKRDAPSKTLAVFADPVYEKDDPRLARAKESNKNPAKSGSRGDETADFLNVNENFPNSFQRLIYSRREANQILALVKSEKDKFSALDFEANYKSATNQNLADFRYLHFAAHGIFNAQNPTFSGVVLSLFNKKGETENGLLSLQDVYNLRLSSELVVLSACRTGLGKQVKGEGVVGLTRGFMYAGSRRVVASLWKVQDDAAAELMSEFYRNMLREGKKPSAAMRLAQISLLKKNQYSSPFFWAAFVHYGEWQ